MNGFERWCRNTCALLLLCWFWPVKAQTLTFAPLPMENPETVLTGWKPFLGYLAEKLGVEWQIVYTDSYTDLIDRFVAGKVDLAYLGPLPYVALKKRLPQATPLIHFKEKDGQTVYTCALFAASDVAKSGLKGLTGKKIALTQPLSTCGYFSASALLQQAGADIEKNRYRYLGKHDAVLDAVAAGEFDLGAAKTAIGKKYAALGLVKLAETPPLPAFALIANSDRISSARRKLIQELIIAAPSAERARWGENIRHGAIAAKDGDYAAVRALLPGHPIPERGNF